MSKTPFSTPVHIALIMDGNGRWAKERGMPRYKGHERGAEVVRDVTKICSNKNIKFLTLYTLSTENFNRPKAELDFLFKLLKRYITAEIDEYNQNNVRFETVGNLSLLSKSLQKTIEKAKLATAKNTGLTQVLALAYGSKDEISRAASKLLQSGEEISSENLQKSLDLPNMPPVDCLIRTGRELRLSNFLLWQSAYAELFFTNTLWPDFGEKDLDEILEDFATRQRRFGKA